MKATTLFASIAACAALVSCQPKQESMHELADRVFALAEQQLPLLSSELGATQCPRSLYANGTLMTSDYKWWCSGFFPGSLWMTYSYTQNPEILALAKSETEKIDSIRFVTDNHDIGFMNNCSFGNGLRLGGQEEYKEKLHQAAHNLATRFNPIAGVTQSWGANKDWKMPVIIDNMMNLELLVRVAQMYNEPELLEIANTHARTTIKNHFRPDYTTYHVVDYDPETGDVRVKCTKQGYADESTWARGEAWALYGYTMMAELTGEADFLSQAEHIARWTIDNLPEDYVQWWDYDAAKVHFEQDPNGYITRDASAAAITASAFAKLSELTKDAALAKECRATAENQVRALASDDYLAKPGEIRGFLLKHSTGHFHGNSEIDVPLTYADYYFLEAILRLQ